MDGAVVVRGAEVFRIEQGPQVAVLTDACNECGNCVTFCPTADRPWRDKPRLYLNREEFEAQTDNAFMFLTVEGSRGLQARSGARCTNSWSATASCDTAVPESSFDCIGTPSLVEDTRTSRTTVVRRG